MTFRYHWLGWYSAWGTWRAENGLWVVDLWKFRFAFGRTPRPVNVFAANRRFERMFWRLR